ncbi:MAG: YebC/PmpR family DNA-binding transcriptional regulator [Verrucomicrobiia bacterium]|jgi:YebC/PmpR family DNA-binding regulatory protein
MSGHSKWSTIKRAKGANDAKRGKEFSKLAREVTIAAKEGGGDPDMNARLRMVMLKCKAANMPADNVQRAISKGVGGGDGTLFEDLTYEIYAPHGVGLLAEISTDNRNRTAAEIRSIVNKAGGNIASAGSVSRLFERKGQIMISRDAADEDALMELALDAGAEDFRVEDEGFEIITDPSAFEEVHKRIESENIKCEAASVTQLALPDTMTPIEDAAAARAVLKLVEGLEDQDDVKDLYSSADIQVDIE